jgi:AcrR family transcriptional regulator
MARTQAADYEQRREAIVAAAADLYAENGFLGASLVDLAARCNYSKSLIYHYYDSKEDILFEVMSTHIEALNEVGDRIAQDAGPADVRLRKLAHAFMALYVDAAARHKVLLNELDHLPPERREQIVSRQRRLLDLVEGLLSEIQPKLKRSKTKARPATMLFFGMINWTHTWYDPAGPATPTLVADLAVDIALGGLRSL